jgi:hypothetical protein
MLTHIAAPDPSNYWASALRFYAKMALRQSAVVWWPALFIPPTFWILHGCDIYQIRKTLPGAAIGVGIATLFFLSSLATAIVYDIKRNWGQAEPSLEWSPFWFYNVLLHCGSVMLLIFAVFISRQSWKPGCLLGVLAIFSNIYARSMLSKKFRLPRQVACLASGYSETAKKSESKHYERAEFHHWHKQYLHPGFVANQYYGFILKGSFLIFITDNGLKGWRFHGLGGKLDLGFYAPAEDMLDDPEFSPGSPAFEELMRLSNSFYLPYSRIKSLKYVKKDKYKLGYIHHAGSLQIYLQGFPSKREFYLLGVGPQHAQKIYQTILSKVESTVA